ncbi:hypothetical protein Egran_04427 [Elaphomyces granulatus]|uniref:Uncharacterized protein n=1 Tax=Elaphomyces granulatus TaxID=519963 RepID=A0A232LVE3_9EURO|nr:hypothetical protein Egran_04427 [Elaphomyces granulatus]
MSVDLLAEFGPGSKSISTTEAYASSKSSAITSTTTSDQNQQSSEPPTSINKSYNLANDFTDPLSGLTRRLSSRVGQAVDVLQLVDATAEDAIDDDWGEFECAETNPKKDQYLNLVEVGIQSSVNQNSASERAKSGYHADPTESLLLKDRVSFAEKKPVEPSSGDSTIDPVASIRPLQEIYDDWGNFAHAPDEAPPQLEQLAKSQNTTSKTIACLPTEEPSKARGQASDAQVRPTNIPPPSVLLQLFPPRLGGFYEKLTTENNTAEGNTSVTESALRLVSMLKVTARVITGRSLRWKRDNILNQSTKIGPARSGKSGGMKLSSVSKNETVREEQEVMEVVEVWRRHAALFNRVILSAGKRPFPVTADKARVTTASPSQGALTAIHPCAICGLKRDERLAKVDEDIEDSFGDWWIDYWGHADCKRFWDESSKLLHQR